MFAYDRPMRPPASWRGRPRLPNSRLSGVVRSRTAVRNPPVPSSDASLPGQYSARIPHTLTGWITWPAPKEGCVGAWVRVSGGGRCGWCWRRWTQNEGLSKAAPTWLPGVLVASATDWAALPSVSLNESNMAAGKRPARADLQLASFFRAFLEKGSKPREARTFER